MTFGATIASSATFSARCAIWLRLRSSWPWCDPAAPCATMRVKCTDTRAGARAIISTSTVGLPGGTRKPMRTGRARGSRFCGCMCGSDGKPKASYSGSAGVTAAARAAPDGYTLVFGTTSTMVVNPLVMKQVPYDFWKDFALIGLIANAPHILAVRDGLPAKSATELVAMAKRDPGKYTIASSGPGTIVQMAAELLKLETGTDLLVVPFKGGQPATLAMLSGEVDMIVNDLTGLKSNLASGKLRELADAHTSRIQLLPDVTTFAELGMPGVISSTWWGI